MHEYCLAVLSDLRYENCVIILTTLEKKLHLQAAENGA